MGGAMVATEESEASQREPAARDQPKEEVVATLHIEHAISDYVVWKGAFDRFASVREQSGVRGIASRSRSTIRVT